MATHAKTGAVRAARPDMPPARPRRHRRNAQWRRDRRQRPNVASLAVALAILPSLPRPMLCRLTARLIDRLDEIDGDELDGINSEDDFWPHSPYLHGPGCPISDSDTGADDRGEAERYDGGYDDHRVIDRHGLMNIG